jgi:outer membrane protein OmpA-like peptidoglycan-associated protein
MSSDQNVHSEVRNSKVDWLPLVLGTMFVLGLIIFIFKGCNGSDDAETMTSTIGTGTDSVVNIFEGTTRESMKLKIPDGTELNAYKNGIEDQLIIFLNNPSAVPGKDVWFDFDNLNFKTGSADITEESNAQIQNIATILKAYPKVKIKIGGYTDKTGDSLSNLKLSQNRAGAVLSALKTSGANSEQLLGSEGYGSQYAKVSADASDEDRKRDRRIAVSVRAK